MSVQFPGGPLAAPPSSKRGTRKIVGAVLIAVGIAVGINSIVGSYLLSKPVDGFGALICFLIGLSLAISPRGTRTTTSSSVSLTVGGKTMEQTFGGQQFDVSSLLSMLGNLPNDEAVKSFVTTTTSTQTFNMGDPSTNALLTTGRRGSARINSVQDTGVKVGDLGLLVLELSVEVDGHQYQATTPSMIPGPMLGRAVVGATVEVRADPANLSNLVIVWA
jgi:hypothetical protein